MCALYRGKARIHRAVGEGELGNFRVQISATRTCSIYYRIHSTTVQFTTHVQATWLYECSAHLDSYNVTFRNVHRPMLVFLDQNHALYRAYGVFGVQLLPDEIKHALFQFTEPCSLSNRWQQNDVHSGGSYIYIYIGVVYVEWSTLNNPPYM